MMDNVTCKLAGRSIIAIGRSANPYGSLYFFPYAGGAAGAFRSWARALPDIACYGVELPGRGMRAREQLTTSLDDIVDSVAEDLCKSVDQPFMFFGHSMGAVIAFEVARKLQTIDSHRPKHLFVSGRQAPQSRRPRRKVYLLPDDQLADAVIRLGGLPTDIANSSGLMDFLIPVLRADFTISQTYTFRAGERLGCGITAFGGTEDSDITLKDLYDWKEQTSDRFEVQRFSGGHFYLNHCQNEVARTILRTALQMHLKATESA
jgi:medium-chain acyl-[acyl-carrier-protein] hydrolase